MKINLDGKFLLVFILYLMASVNFVYSDQVILNNNDIISGTVLNNGEHTIELITESMGTIVIKKKYVEKINLNEKIKSTKNIEKLSLVWDRNISLGYDRAGGNTENAQMNGSLLLHAKTDHDEFNLRGSAYYSSSDKKMNTQQWAAMMRYAYSFWEKKWYNFYKFEISHDRFANVDYRFIPSTGIGYWLYDKADLRVMYELGAGFEHTTYNGATKSSEGIVIIPRGFIEKRIFNNLKVSQEIILYPSLRDSGEIRVYSESSFIETFNEKLSLVFKFINVFDSNPAAAAKNNDFKFISSLQYSF